MKLISNTIKALLASIAVGILFASCLQNEFKEKEDDERAKIKSYANANGFTDANLLPSGIYLKFQNDTAADTNTIKPITGNTVIVEYTGMYTDGTVFETTDADLGASLFPERYFVYGPIRLKMGTLMYGFDTTLRYMSQGDEATMIIPSKYMWYDYNPVVYQVKLDSIVPNDSIYEADMFKAFKQLAGFNEADTFRKNANQDNLYWKVISKSNDPTGNPDSLHSSPNAVTINDSILIDLVARYAEVQVGETGTKSIGRIYYPLTTYPSEFVYLWGNTSSFPLTPAVDSAVKAMGIGDEIEICAPASWAYGKNGFSDEFHNIIAVPPSTPVHYQIKLLGYRSKTEGSVWVRP